jgi:transaldolase
MTEDTIAAFADHGKVSPQSIATELEEALKVLCQDLPAVGIAFDHVTWQFQHEGIQKLIEPFDALIQSLVNKTKQSQEFLSDPAWHAR